MDASGSGIHQSDSVLTKHRIRRNEDQSLHLRLCNQHAVKQVTVMSGQFNRLFSVTVNN